MFSSVGRPGAFVRRPGTPVRLPPSVLRSGRGGLVGWGLCRLLPLPGAGLAAPSVWAVCSTAHPFVVMCWPGSLDPQESCYIHEEETLQLRLAEVEFLTSQTDILEKLTKLVALIRLRQRAVSHRISFLVKRIRLVSEALEQVIQEHDAVFPLLH